MGWWTQDATGKSFSHAPEPMFWGDGPADVMDAALAAIEEKFLLEHARIPTKAELRAGLEFSLGGYHATPGKKEV